MSSVRDAAIAAAVAAVSRDRLEEDVAQLVGFKDRSAGAAHIGAVANHLRKRFLHAGFDSDRIKLLPFPFESAQHNVVCSPRRFGRSAILIGAHYDSTSSVLGDAPGANDNASGVAAMLELARLLSQQTLSVDLVFAAFGAEEHNCSGSRHLAQVAAAQRWPLALMINIDQVARPPDSTTVVVEYELRSHQTPYNDVASRAFGALMAQMASTYTFLTPKTADIRDSDYMPFEEMGFPCVGVFEGGESRHVHSPADTIAALDFDYLRQVVQMVLATVVMLAR
jgi:Zn-dependent M28 family amino/carboxypeptidase